MVGSRAVPGPLTDVRTKLATKTPKLGGSLMVSHTMWLWYGTLVRPDFPQKKNMCEEENLRPILSVLRHGQLHRTSSLRLKAVSNVLTWRQSYESSEQYSYPLDEATVDGEGERLLIRQIRNGEMKELGTGTFVWPAAIVMTKYLEKCYRENKNVYSGKRCIDIGSGTGITGIIATLLGFSEVVLTDQECVLSLMEENVTTLMNYCQRNAVGIGSVRCSDYDWGGDHNHLQPPFDVILVSDCVLPKLYPILPLILAVKAVMNSTSRSYFSYEHRPYPLFDPRDEFVRLCRLNDMKVRKIPVVEHHEFYNCEEIELWEVTLLD